MSNCSMACSLLTNASPSPVVPTRRLSHSSRRRSASISTIVDRSLTATALPLRAVRWHGEEVAELAIARSSVDPAQDICCAESAVALRSHIRNIQSPNGLHVRVQEVRGQRVQRRPPLEAIARVRIGRGRVYVQASDLGRRRVNAERGETKPMRSEERRVVDRLTGFDNVLVRLEATMAHNVSRMRRADKPEAARIVPDSQNSNRQCTCQPSRVRPPDVVRKARGGAHDPQHFRCGSMC